MAYRSDIKFLDECNAAMINVNAEEYKRVARLTNTIKSELDSLRSTIEWESDARTLCNQKLQDATKLLSHFTDAFDKAGNALANYAQEVTEAKKSLNEGAAQETELKKMSTHGWLHSDTFREAEPLKQWEDLRQTSDSNNVLSVVQDAVSDWFAVDSDEKQRGDELYQDIHQHFDQALRTEAAARANCVVGLTEAFQLLPEVQTGTDANEAIKSIPGMTEEMLEASKNVDVRLPGTGQLLPYDDTTSVSSAVSPALQHIRELAASLPGGNKDWNVAHNLAWYSGALSEHAFKLRWVEDNKEVIKAAAKQYGLPADVLAGVAYLEVGGKTQEWDDITFIARNILPESIGGSPDETSFGPMAIQVRRAAESLGYDPTALTDGQRIAILNSLTNTKENIFIAAQHLSDLKQSTDFALAEPEQMTAQQGEQLAAMYNGGPYWEGGDAQNYAKGFAEHRTEAAKQLN